MSGMSEQVSAVTAVLTETSAPAPEVKQEEQAATVTAKATPSETPEEPIDGAVDGHHEPAEGEGEGDAAEPPESPAEAATGKAPEDIKSLKDFAEATGWDIKDIYGLTVKLEGTGEEVSIGQFKDRIQHAAQAEAQLKAQRVALEKEQAAFRDAAQQVIGNQQQLSNDFIEATARARSIQERFNAINWETLEQNDPGRAALLQQQIAADYAGANHDIEVAKQKQTQQQQAYQAQIQQQQAAHIKAHNDYFLKAVPEWADPEVAQREAPVMKQYLEQWFKPQELGTIYDWRARMLARKAMLWDIHQHQAGKLDKQVRSAPKQVLRPGSGSTVQSAGNLKSLMQKASATKNRGDQVAAINALIGNKPG